MPDERNCAEKLMELADRPKEHVPDGSMDYVLFSNDSAPPSVIPERNFRVGRSIGHDIVKIAYGPHGELDDAADLVQRNSTGGWSLVDGNQHSSVATLLLKELNLL
jgi:hypothetical protein